MNVNAKALSEALAIAGRLVDKTCVSDSRGCVHLEASSRRLLVKGYDQSHLVEMCVPASGGPQVPQGMSVPIQTVSAVVSNAAKRCTELVIEVSDRDAQHPMLAVGTTTLVGRPATGTFPFSTRDPVRVGVVDPAVLHRGLRCALPALNPRHHDGNLRGMSWEQDEIVATDGHRLHRAPLPIVDGALSMPVVFDETMIQLLLRAIAPGMPVEVLIGGDLASTDEHAPFIRFQTRAACVTMRLPDSSHSAISFPDWHDAAADAAVGVEVLVAKADLLDAVDLSGVTTNPSAVLTTNGTRLDVIVSDDVMRSAVSVMTHNGYALRPGRGVRLHRKYLYDALAVIGSSVVRLTFSGPSTPIRVASAKGDDAACILMPMSEFVPTFCRPEDDVVGRCASGPAAWYQAELQSSWQTSRTDGDRQWLQRYLSGMDQHDTEERSIAA